jgi:hypothetical protein
MFVESQYVNVNTRQNNHVFVNRPPVIENVHVSPMHIGGTRFT